MENLVLICALGFVVVCIVGIVWSIIRPGWCPECKRLFAGEKIGEKKIEPDSNYRDPYCVHDYKCRYCGETWERKYEPYSDL
jgi:hypothetical protein